MPSEELKPVEQIIEIPIELIRENPDNPRPVIPEEAKTMAESLAASGQRTAVVLRPQTEAEKAQFPPTLYLLLGGHRRLAGAKLAGLKTLKAVLVTLKTPYEELKVIALDNGSKPMTWWETDLLIERFFKADPDLKQNRLATELGLSPTKVNFALKVTQALTPAARGLVTQNLASHTPADGQKILPLNSKNKGFLITESILLALADLGDSQEVEKALTRVVDDQMTESQVRQMVAWVKAGKDPGEFGKAKGQKSPSSQPSPLKGEGESYHKSPLNPPLSKGGKASQQPDLHSQIGTLMASHELGKRLHLPGQMLERLFPPLTRLFHRSRGLFTRVGVKNQTMATFFTLLLFLFVGSTLIGITSRVMNSLIDWFVFSHLSSGTQAGRQAPVGMIAPAPPVNPQTVSPPNPQAANPLNPTQNPKPSAHNPPKSAAIRPPAFFDDDFREPPVPDELKQRVADDKDAASGFASHFYDFSYKNNFKDWRDRCDNWITTSYDDAFDAGFFSQDRQGKFMDGKMYYEFSQTGDPKLVKLTDTTADIAVVGDVALRGDAVYERKLFWKKRMALVATFFHNPDNSWGVTMVREVPDAVTPAAQAGAAQAKGQDLGRQIGAGVHDATDAVKTADEAKSDSDKAKSLVGF